MLSFWCALNERCYRGYASLSAAPCVKGYYRGSYFPLCCPLCEEFRFSLHCFLCKMVLQGLVFPLCRPMYEKVLCRFTFPSLPRPVWKGTAGDPVPLSTSPCVNRYHTGSCIRLCCPLCERVLEGLMFPSLPPPVWEGTTGVSGPLSAQVWGYIFTTFLSCTGDTGVSLRHQELGPPPGGGMFHVLWEGSEWHSLLANDWGNDWLITLLWWICKGVSLPVNDTPNKFTANSLL